MSYISSIIGQFTTLKNSGKELSGRCPLHNDKTASLYVNEEKGVFHCFGCGKGGDEIKFLCEHDGIEREEAIKKVVTMLGISEKEYLKEKDIQVQIIKEKKFEEVEPLPMSFVREFVSSVGYAAHGYRGIRDEINKFYGHLTKLGSDGSVQARYYPETDNKGRLVGYKCRNHPKDFTYGKVGHVGQTNQLSGQIKFNSNHKYVLICGGQEDKAAAYQMLLDSQKSEGFAPIPVVSPTTGENCVKQVSLQIDWFDKFDNIIIGFDNDKAGIKAAAAVAAILPKDKVKIATWSGKDPNQMLLEGKQKQFVRDFYNAKEYVSSGISSVCDAIDKVDDFLKAPKISLPAYMHRIQSQLNGGIRSTGAIVNIVAPTSIGKSLLSDMLIYHWVFNSPITPTIISLERTQEELLIDMESLHLKKNLMWFKDGMEAINYRHLPEVKELREQLYTNEEGKPRFFIIDERHSTIEGLKKQMERASLKYDSNLFIIDPLTDLVRSLGLEGQDDFMLWEKQQKKEGKVFINILHTRKSSKDKDGNETFVTEYDALGSGSFVQSADINIVLNREKMASDPVVRNTTIVDIPKARGGITGRVEGGLYFDVGTRQQYDLIDWQNQVGYTSTSDTPAEEQTEEQGIDF